MKCKNCGIDVEDLPICPACGTELENFNRLNYLFNSADLIFAIIAFLDVFLAAVLYFYYKDKNDYRTSMILKGAKTSIFLTGVLFPLTWNWIPPHLLIDTACYLVRNLYFYIINFI